MTASPLPTDRQGTGQDFLAPRQVRRLDDTPFADPQEAVRAAPGMRPGEHRVRFRLLVPHEFHRQFAGVAAGDRQLSLQGRIKAFVGHQRDVPQLLPRVLQRLVDQRDLLAHPEAKPVRADDAQQRREAKLAGLQDDDPPAILPVNQVDDLLLLLPRSERDDRPVARPDRIEIAEPPAGIAERLQRRLLVNA